MYLSQYKKGGKEMGEKNVPVSSLYLGTMIFWYWSFWKSKTVKEVKGEPPH